MSAARLPQDWAVIIDEIQRRLASALRETQEPAPTAPTELASARETEWTALAERLGAVGTRAAEATAALAPVDEALAAEETALQTYLGACAALRSRLADWTGRAIG